MGRTARKQLSLLFHCWKGNFWGDCLATILVLSSWPPTSAGSLEPGVCASTFPQQNIRLCKMRKIENCLLKGMITSEMEQWTKIGTSGLYSREILLDWWNRRGWGGKNVLVWVSLRNTEIRNTYRILEAKRKGKSWLGGSKLKCVQNFGSKA